MKSLESITTSLDVSKRLDVALKKAEIEVEPLFDWCEIDEDEWIVMRRNKKEYEKIVKEYGELEGCIPALTASEIGEILSKRLRYWTDLRKAYCEVMDLTEDIIIPEQRVLNMMEQPDIGGEVIIYLADNGLLINNK